MTDPQLVENGPELPLRELLREDLESHGGSWLSPGWHAMVVYRIGYWAAHQGRAVRLLVGAPVKLFNRVVIRNIYGTEIAVEAELARRVCIGHHQGVQIPGFCVIGEDTLVRHNVTIGFTGTSEARHSVPRIGRRVEIGAGATLLGPITIGDDAKIGPHAIVTMDVPAGATAFAPPARIMKAAPKVEEAPPAA
jgi:serine O-acetyltransferase